MQYINPWGPDGAGGLATLNKLIAANDAAEMQKRKDEQDLARQRVALDEVNRARGMRDEYESGLTELQGQQQNPFEYQSKAEELRSKINPTLDVLKTAVDITPQLKAQMPGRVQANQWLASMGLPMYLSGASPEEITKAIAPKAQSLGIAPEEILKGLRLLTKLGPNAAMSESNGIISTYTIGPDGQVDVKFLQNKKSTDPEWLDFQRESLAERRAAREDMNMRTNANISSRRELADPSLKAQQEQGKAIGKEQGKYAVEMRKKYDEGKVTLQKIAAVRSRINDPNFRAGVLGKWQANIETMFPSFKNLSTDNQRAALQTYAPMLMADLKTLLGPQISNADADMMLKYTGGDFNNTSAVNAALTQIEQRINTEMGTYKGQAERVQAPAARQMVAPKQPTPMSRENIQAAVREESKTIAPGKSKEMTFNGLKATITKNADGSVKVKFH